jgi:hypothetical protein
MRSLTVALLLAALVGAGCAASGPSPSPSPSPSGPALPADGLWLRATMTQAIPPIGRFGWFPAVAITADGVVVTQGAVLAIFPGPLLPPLSGRSMSAEGFSRIVEAARDLGLLTGQSDFTGGAKPGQALGRIEFVAGDRVVELLGDPGRVMQCITTPCDPAPGSPEAFGAFWQRITDLSWLGSDLGREAPYQPQAYAILVGPAPDPQGFPQAPADWPLDAPLATLGDPVGDGIHRCATIRGEDAATLRPALEAANQITAWTQDPSTSATFGLSVRPLLPGEDVCRELFPIGG